MNTSPTLGLALLAIAALVSCADEEQFVCPDFERPLHTELGWSYIPPGTFLMGAGPEWQDRESWRSRVASEAPAHEVTLTRGFFIMQTEVPVQLFVELAGVLPPYFLSYNNRLGAAPVLNGDYSDGLLFANLLSARDGLPQCYELPSCATDHDTPQPKGWCGRSVTVDPECDGYRLPSEAEWEYAARAGTTTAYFFGDDPHRVWDYASVGGTGGVYWLNDRDEQSMCANNWGLFDVIGSGAEWVWDLSTPAYYLEGPHVDPFGLPRGTPASEANVVLRGGSEEHLPVDSTVWSRIFLGPDTHFGSRSESFRLVRTAPPGFTAPAGPVDALPPPRE